MKNLIVLYMLLSFCQHLSAQYTISGHVTREDQMPVPNAGVILYQGDNTVLDTVFTDVAGNYNFENLPAGAYKVSSFKQGNEHNGVTLNDAYIIMMHILGIQPIPSPNYLVFADFNSSVSVTAYDIVELRNFILYESNCTTCFHGWYVLREGVIVEDNGLPNDYSSYDITLNDDADNINFTAYKVGDVNLSNNPAE